MAQGAERDAFALGLLGHQRDRREARLRVDLQEIEAGRAGLAVVVAEVAAADARTANRLVRQQRHALRLFGDGRRHRSRQQMLGMAGRIFRGRNRTGRPANLISVTPRARSPITPTVSSRPAMYSSTSACSPKVQLVAQDGRVAAVGDDAHADRGAFRDRLDDIGPRDRIAGGKVGAGREDALGHAHADRGDDALGARLVHRDRRGEHARMRVGNAHQLEQALDAAILAEAAVQHVEDDVGLAASGRRRSRRHRGRHPACARRGPVRSAPWRRQRR